MCNKEVGREPEGAGGPIQLLRMQHSNSLSSCPGSQSGAEDFSERFFVGEIDNLEMG
jgi:hypothetical protein